MQRLKRLRGAWILALLVMLPSCSSWYSSIHQTPDGKFAMTGNLLQGLAMGGPKAQLWEGTYDPATKTMTITKMIEEGL